MSEKWRTGRIHHVPCPWPDCGKPNDFRQHKEVLVDQWSGAGATDNPWFQCDHCGRGVEVVKAEVTTLLSVRATDKASNLGVR